MISKFRTCKFNKVDAHQVWAVCSTDEDIVDRMKEMQKEPCECKGPEDTRPFPHHNYKFYRMMTDGKIEECTPMPKEKACIEAIDMRIYSGRELCPSEISTECGELWAVEE